MLLKRCSAALSRTTVQEHQPFRRRLAASLAVLLSVSTAVVATERSVAADAPYNTSRVESILGSAGNTVWREAAQGAINPNDFECEPGAIDAWIDELLAGSDPATLDILFGTAAPDWPIVYKLFFDDDDSDEFIGVDGDYTREHIKRQRDLLKFWDVPLEDVGLYGMHGAVMQDDAKMVPVVQFILEVDAATAQEIVDLVQGVIESDATIGYDWPLFSFNAVAFGPDPLKVVMGDGLISFFEDVGLANNGVDLVYGHEMAHQVQGALGLFDTPPSPEATRRTELMADAFATYYLVHARGASFNAARAVDTFELSFIAGDCNFDSDGHHGTPNQRRVAAEWGAEVAQERPRGKIKSASTMVALFDAALPTIVAPDTP